MTIFLLFLLHNEISVLEHDFQQKKTVKLNPAWDELKIMLKKLKKIYMMEMKYQFDVDKYLPRGE